MHGFVLNKEQKGEKKVQNNVHEAPKVLNHQAIQFETAQSWNPGKGNRDHPGTGNDGINFPPGNPNPPGGAGTPGKGNGKK